MTRLLGNESKLSLLLVSVSLSVLGLGACRPATADSSLLTSNTLDESKIPSPDPSIEKKEISPNAPVEEVKAYLSWALDSEAGVVSGEEPGLNLNTTSASVIQTSYVKGGGVSPPSYTKEQLLQLFVVARDTKFIPDSKGRKRRLSWLYPDDGCFARAALANYLATSLSNLPAPARVFSFGVKNQATLSVPSKYARPPVEKVTWWYHVAAVVQVEGQSYVIDPAIEPKRPMKLEEWLDIQGKVERSVICDANSYMPGSYCVGSPNPAGNAWQAMRSRYLDSEWNRVKQLSFDPVSTLLGETLQY